MMLKQFIITILFALLLAACATGKSSSTSNGPQAVVDQALAAMQAEDRAALTTLYDRTNDLARFSASADIDDWRGTQEIPVGITNTVLGPMQSHAVRAATISGRAAYVTVTVTYERGTADWRFVLHRDGEHWGLTEIAKKAEQL